MMALPALQHRAVRATRGLRAGRQPAPGVESRTQLRELRTDGQPGARDRPGCRVIGPSEALALMPAISPDSLYGAVHLTGDGHLDPTARPTRSPMRPGRSGSGSGPGRPGDRLRALGPTRDHARPDRRRPDRHGARRERGRDLGAAGRGDGRGVRAVHPGRPPAHRAQGRPRLRAAARHAVLPRSGQPRLRQERARRDGLRRVRDGSGVALGGRRPVGSRRRSLPPGLRAVRAAHGRGDPALPVPRPMPTSSASSVIRTR